MASTTTNAAPAADTITTLEKPRQCWECLRRERPCDGANGFCGNCQASGIVCPGYSDHRPLTWLPIGKTTRLRDSKVKTGKNPPHKTKKALVTRMLKKTSVTPPSEAMGMISKARACSKHLTPISLLHYNIRTGDFDAHEDVSKGDHGSDVENLRPSKHAVRDLRCKTTTALLQQRGISYRKGVGMVIPPSLRPEQWDIVETIEFYNIMIFPALGSIQLMPPTFNGPFTGSDFCFQDPTLQHTMVASALVYRILSLQERFYVPSDRLTVIKSGEGLQATFYRRIGLAIQALNKDISTNRNIDNIGHYFVAIYLILSAEVSLSSRRYWNAHIRGFMELIRQCGGMKALVGSTPAITQSIFHCTVLLTMTNTTTTRHDLVAEASSFDDSTLYTLFMSLHHPAYLCPPDLLVDIVRINRLRLQSTSPKNRSDHPTECSTCDILRQIDEFSPEDWFTSGHVPESEELRLLARTFQSATAVYAAYALPCTSKSQQRPCHSLALRHRGLLFSLLKESLESSMSIYNVLWPITVAGVAAASGTQDERDFVGDCLDAGCGQNFIRLTFLIGRDVLKKFWASGNTGWDDCFAQQESVLA